MDDAPADGFAAWADEVSLAPSVRMVADTAWQAGFRNGWESRRKSVVAELSSLVIALAGLALVAYVVTIFLGP